MIDINFYDYKKKITIEHELEIDVSGLKVKSDASNINVDENGNIEDVNMNEIIDEKVNFIYDRDVYKYEVDKNTSFPLNEDDEIQIAYLKGESVIDQFNLIRYNESGIDATLTTIGVDENNNPKQYNIPIIPQHKKMQNVDENGNNIDFLEFDNKLRILQISSLVATEELVSYFDVAIPIYTKILTIQTVENHGFGDIVLEDKTKNSNVDRYQIDIIDSDTYDGTYLVSTVIDEKTFTIKFNGNTPSVFGSITNIQKIPAGVTRGPLIDREIYAAIGMWNNNNFKISPYGLESQIKMGISDTKASPYISKKEYNKRLINLKQKLNEVGIDVIVTEFTESRPQGGIDVNNSFISRRNAKNFSYTKNAGLRFIEYKNLSGLLTPNNSETISPVNISIKEVFKAQFDSAEELKDQLINHIYDLVNSVNKIPGGKKIFGKLVRTILIDESEIQGDKPVLQSFISKNRYIINEITGNPESTTSNMTIEDVLQKYYISKMDQDDKDKINLGDVKNKGQIVIRTSINPENGQVIPSLIPEWETDPSTGIFPIENNNFVLSQEKDIVINENFDVKKLTDDINKIIKKIKRFGFVFSSPLINFALGDIRSRSNELKEIIDKIKWFERFTNESIAENKKFLSSVNEDVNINSSVSRYRLTGVDNPNQKLCRVLMPVDFGIKRGKKKRSWKRAFIAKRSRKDLGIRWVELRFIDTRVLSLYRQNEKASGIIRSFRPPIPLTLIYVSTVEKTEGDNEKVFERTIIFNTEEPHNLDDKVLQVEIIGSNQHEYNGYLDPVQLEGNIIKFIFTYQENELPDSPTGDFKLASYIEELNTTPKSKEKENVNIDFNIPTLPYDSDLRDIAYKKYGYFDQTQFSDRQVGTNINVTNNNGVTYNTNIIPDGFEIFKESSKDISDMREGIDVYNKTQFLLEILNKQFSTSRVKLIETTRSWVDQEVLQMGGSSSSFLSWHNFGLAVKILITKEDETTLIQEGDADFFMLADIAEVFIEGCKLGKFGKPANVVWCAQLVTGPDMFVWEFLPIGVGHRESWRFRQSIYNQKDPIIDNSYINVDKKRYVINENMPKPTTPYVVKESSVYQEAIIINDNRYISPREINNLYVPSDIILKDIQEFLFMIKQKMIANGTTLENNIQEWKINNPISFQQLLMYYCLIGNFTASKGIIATDYIEKFDYLVNNISEKNPVQFVKQFLGDEYNNTKIYLSNFGDGSYISLSNGKIVIPVVDVRSSHPYGSGNTFGQKLITKSNIEYGRYDSNGIFIPESVRPIELIVSKKPVIGGYSIEGTPESGDAVLLHIVIKNKIVEEYNLIKDIVTNLQIDFLYDDIENSPNSDLLPLLENEFGIINTQTLLPINELISGFGSDVLSVKQLRDIFDRKRINELKNSPVDNSVRGAGHNIENQNLDGDFDNNKDTNKKLDGNKNQSVFEKLISNAQLQGVYLANISKEKPIIEELKGDDTVENTLKKISKNRTPDVRDLL